MEFEWDEAKSEKNLRTHGIAFDEVAARISGEGFIDSFPNPSPNPNYLGQAVIRFLSKDGREWVAVVEPRGKTFRIITAQQRRKYRSKK